MDPVRALDALQQALAYTHQHRLPLLEANIARHAAGLEAVHGELDHALVLFDTAIDSLYRSGNYGDLIPTLAYLVVFFDRTDRFEVAAIVYGTSTRHGTRNRIHNRGAVLDHLRAVLGETLFDESVATGAAMESADAVHYARQQIQLARQELGSPPATQQVGQ